MTPLKDHIFVGTRQAFHDVPSTQILAGAATDRESGASVLNLEASGRSA